VPEQKKRHKKTARVEASSSASEQLHADLLDALRRAWVHVLHQIWLAYRGTLRVDDLKMIAEAWAERPWHPHVKPIEFSEWVHDRESP
jgi:hypothetical protein